MWFVVSGVVYSGIEMLLGPAVTHGGGDMYDTAPFLKEVLNTVYINTT